VVSLWKLLVGAPVFVLWGGFVSLALLYRKDPLALCVYLLLTWAGLKLWYRAKKLAVAVHNGYRRPELGPRLLAFREEVLRVLESSGA
jgi:hypothetical protein